MAEARPMKSLPYVAGCRKALNNPVLLGVLLSRVLGVHDAVCLPMVMTQLT